MDWVLVIVILTGLAILGLILRPAILSSSTKKIAPLLRHRWIIKDPRYPEGMAIEGEIVGRDRFVAKMNTGTLLKAHYEYPTLHKDQLVLEDPFDAMFGSSSPKIINICDTKEKQSLFERQERMIADLEAQIRGMKEQGVRRVVRERIDDVKELTKSKTPDFKPKGTTR